MAVPTFLQSNTAASDTVAATTHTISLTSPVTSQGGLVCPSAIVVQVSYDGNTGELVTGITDTAGNTYVKGQDSLGVKTVASNSAGTNGEMWVAFRAVGGIAPTITVTTSAAVKMKLAAAELDQIAPYSPLDGTSDPVDRNSARLDTTAGTAQRNSAPVTGGGAYTTKRQGMMAVCVGGIAWNLAKTVTTTSPWTGLVTLQGGATNLGVALERKTAEVLSIAPTFSVARFVLSGGATTDPAAVMCLTLFRNGVATGNDQDCMLDNIEGVVTKYDMAPEFVYRSSAAAPMGGTGGSEYCQMFNVFPRYYKPAGTTLADMYGVRMRLTDGYDDGLDYFNSYARTFNAGQVGSTIEEAEWDTAASRGDGPFIFINIDENNFSAEQEFYLYRSLDWNDTGVSVLKLTMEGDGLGAGTSNYMNVHEYQSNIPLYAVFEVTYPTLASTPLRTLMGVGT